MAQKTIAFTAWRRPIVVSKVREQSGGSQPLGSILYGGNPNCALLYYGADGFRCSCKITNFPGMVVVGGAPRSIQINNMSNSVSAVKLRNSHKFISENAHLVLQLNTTGW